MAGISTRACIVALYSGILSFCVATASPENISLEKDRILGRVRSVLPREAVSISGELRVTKQKGIVVREHPVRILVDFDEAGGTAEYAIQDPRTSRVEKLRVRYSARGKSVYSYIEGINGQKAEAPPLFSPIQDTSISWLDLTLSFLWWEVEQIAGMDSVKGRDCHVVVVRPPDSVRKEKPGSRPENQYSKVKLWIDAKVFMVLQAEGYDAKGELVRRLTIRSLRKIEERWMIKEMEIEARPFNVRTRLHVNDMRVKKDYEPIFD